MLNFSNMYRRKSCWRSLFLERCYATSCNQRQRKVEQNRRSCQFEGDLPRKHTLVSDQEYLSDTTARKRQRNNKRASNEKLSFGITATCSFDERQNPSSTMVTLQDTEFLPSDDEPVINHPTVICPLCSAAALDCCGSRVFCSSCGMAVNVGASIRPLSYLLDRMDSVVGEHKSNCSGRLTLALDAICNTSLIAQCVHCSYYDIVV